MERFIVSARKYRPDNFESLIGQSNIATTLKNSITRKQLAHAYLFCGPRGVGKTTTARIFAKTINCFTPGDNMEPCGTCESCISFAQGRSYSIHELDAASNNSVDDIRQLTELVRIPPQIGKYSVYIIDEVHMLSSAAFNAFLKTLEEPPAHAIFILATTEKHKILPTILSRCQTYDFNRISVDDIVKSLSEISLKESVKADVEALHIIAQKGDGSLRDALTLFDQAVAFCGDTITYQSVISTLNVLDYDYYIRLTNFFLESDHSNSLILFDEILSKGFNALHFIGGLSCHFRDLLVCKDDRTAALLELSPVVTGRYKEQASRCSFRFLYEALSITTACEAGYKSSGHPRLHIEFALIKLCKVNDNAIAGNRTNAKQNMNEISDSEKEDKQAKQKTENIKKDVTNTNGSAKSLSIKELIKTAGNNSINTAPGSNDKIGKDSILAEKLLEVWLKMAEAESSLPRLSTTISQSLPVIEGDNKIVFPVKNELQKSWIEQNCKPRLVEFLKVNLNNRDISLEIEVSPDEEKEEKLYMPQQKADFLKQKHPEVNEIIDDLKLELN